MLNDSSTGGYLAPSSTGGELNDEALRVFLQQLVAGVTGLPGAQVFPRWQPEPPLLPAFGVDWAAVGAQRRRRSVYAVVLHEGSGQGDDLAFRNILLDVLCSFYGPNCEANSELLAVGLQMAQNREVLNASGYTLVEVEDTVTAADKLHNRWLTRCDTPFCLRRAQEYRYPVLNLLGGSATVQDDGGNAQNIVVNSQSGVPQLPLFGLGLQTGLIAGFGIGNWK